MYKSQHLETFGLLDVELVVIVVQLTLHCIVAVSYTHLDVYKRQIQTVLKRDGRVVGFNEEKIATAIRKAMSVSYTHLDVYKRQLTTPAT